MSLVSHAHHQRSAMELQTRKRLSHTTSFFCCGGGSCNGSASVRAAAGGTATNALTNHDTNLFLGGGQSGSVSLEAAEKVGRGLQGRQRVVSKYCLSCNETLTCTFPPPPSHLQCCCHRFWPPPCNGCLSRRRKNTVGCTKHRWRNAHIVWRRSPRCRGIITTSKAATKRRG